MDATVYQITQRRTEVVGHEKVIAELTKGLKPEQKKELSDWENKNPELAGKSPK